MDKDRIQTLTNQINRLSQGQNPHEFMCACMNAYNMTKSYVEGMTFKKAIEIGMTNILRGKNG